MCTRAPLLVGDVVDGLPNEIFPAVDLRYAIGKWMRDGLIGSDGLAKGDALAGIGRGKPNSLAGQTRKRRRNQQLPLLDNLGKGLEGFSARRQNHARAISELELGN